MKPVSVSNHAFVFCRYSISLLVWAAWLLQSIQLLAAATVILGLSAALTVRRAPMIVLYSQTVQRLYPPRPEVLDETAMRFAHVLGTTLGCVCLAGIWMNPAVGWRFTLLFAMLKTISALGFCPASKLFTCATNTTCCPVAKKFLGVCQPQQKGEVKR